ncbi:hypothetical protein TBLA_0A08470 [Henningerozyma blattae CBS 6284]|uniref:Polynucleotide 5'-hydroxyl-kinase GRC3 n=1 Tax=Henningerozyma blattae (strain ATCC 34711 / CBS 6284 / DSM 70876 / NBRC 10599 / NRRL Y-10934 / UCD 77-7) TaxID=1071380 RepID=I2GWY4_HENB6|nr:hypothetical protein TBLA_0A08470 [Tetrapisispora blattae CBS 6284]CCH58636.1 hypothetical protein TBLA_0A08470 [Tetrapisispora blattae CBS 6284]
MGFTLQKKKSNHIDLAPHSMSLPQYYSNSDSSDDDNNSSDLELITTSHNQTKKYVDEYEEETIEPTNKTFFNPLINLNIFHIDNSNSIFVGLKNKQHLYLSGIFQLQIIKGGIIYNNIHYNASKEEFTFWHPLNCSIPPLQSSFFAGWNEIILKDKSFNMEKLNHFDCILKISNSKTKNLNNAFNLFPELKYLWNLRDTFMNSIWNKNFTFNILNENIDSFHSLIIPNNWVTNIEKLKISQKNSLLDMKILIIGAKNSGKSTLNRLLLETFINEKEFQDDILYVDLDPGQPEYSSPDCISITKIDKNSKIFGQHLAQLNFNKLKEIYIGSSSPQDFPTKYLNAINQLISFLNEENFIGTSLINLPGWIKGFGIKILNYIIQLYKPTDLIFLESTSSKSLYDELEIPESFTSNLRENYKPIIYNIPSILNIIETNQYSPNSSTLNFFQQTRFHASQLRTFKLIAYFHKQIEEGAYVDYDFQPLIHSSPIQISYGEKGICGIQLLEEFLDINPEDIKNTLEGTVVAIQKSLVDIKSQVKFKGSFPFLNSNNIDLQFIALGIIHSIDDEKKIINIYIPKSKLEQLNKNPNIQWVLTRAKTETPLCEIYPPNSNIRKQYSTIPYISTERRKKFEHVWKVRKNVMRRGHHMK